MVLITCILLVLALLVKDDFVKRLGTQILKHLAGEIKSILLNPAVSLPAFLIVEVLKYCQAKSFVIFSGIND